MKNKVFPIYKNKIPFYKVAFRGQIMPAEFRSKPEAKRHLAHLIAQPLKQQAEGGR